MGVIRYAFLFVFALFFVPHKGVNAAPERDVQYIEIQGLKKIEEGSLLPLVSGLSGKRINADAIRQSIDRLYSLGHFSDVRVLYRGSDRTLIFDLEEKPSIQKITFEGSSEVSEDDLKEALDVEVFQNLDIKKVRTSIDKVLKLYEDKGFFLATIDFETKPSESNPGQVELVFKISENQMVQVKRIKFRGNTHFSSERLKGSMVTSEEGFFSFLGGSGAYKQDAFDRDLKMLQFLYYNEGFIQVKIGRPEVTITPDKRSMVISIAIEEGEQFRVSKVDFSGDLLFSDEKLLETVSLREGDLFSYQKMQTDLSALQALYGDLGYAFVNPIPRTKINEEQRTVDIIFEIDKGEKVYFGEINVVGNTSTRDKVIRREIRIYEGELYNETARRISLENIQRLGFFEEVNFKTSVPPDRPNRMDIDIVVKERNTGSIQFGAGLASGLGFTLNGQLNQTNFLGKGQSIAVNINANAIQQEYRASFTEPYFLDSNWSMGGNLYRTMFQRSLYLDIRQGGAVNVGHPFNDYLRLFGSYSNYITTVENGFGINDQTYDNVLFPKDQSSGRTSSLGLTLEYDRRNDRFAPSRGFYTQVGGEYVGLGGDFEYTRFNFNVRWYKGLFWDLVLRTNFTYGLLQSRDGDPESIPFTERFLLGGPNTLRGFRFFQVGQRRQSLVQQDFLLRNGVPADRAFQESFLEFGGTQQFFYNVELEFPLIKDAGIRGVVFYDAGHAEDQIQLDDLYANVGFGVRWFSPMGPLRFEFGFPTRRDPLFHQSQNFVFSIGTPF